MDDSTSVSPLAKNVKKICGSDVHSSSFDKLLHHSNIKHISPEPFLMWYGKAVHSVPKESADIIARNIVDCFVHPEVISVICNLLKKL